MAIPKFFVREGIVDNLVPLFVHLLLDHRQWAEGFGEKNQLQRVDGDFPHLRPKHKSFHADEITDVKKLERIVGLTELVLFQIHLDLATRILKMTERGFPHSAKRSNPPGNGNVTNRCIILEAGEDFR